MQSRNAKEVEKTCWTSERNLHHWRPQHQCPVGVFTMTATWVGGGYIMGTAETVYSPTQGLVWALGPPAFAINFLLSGLFFARPMRSKRYVTMLDPFQIRYGNIFTAIIMLPALFSDVLWVACILAALGGKMSIILGISAILSIIISAAVSISYTLLGGLYSVAYTDIFQLCFLFVSLWICVPFMVLSPAVTPISQTLPLNQTHEHAWMGHLELADAGKWVDEMLLLVKKQTKKKNINWNQTAYGLPPPFERGDAGKILPLSLQHLTPTWVALAGHNLDIQWLKGSIPRTTDADSCLEQRFYRGAETRNSLR
ncbi:high-affinity choline transporter 1-like [Poecilia formosa]|uniref:high-affinity choline transporter 1-like n=1 Tax=Poecilia formosa TaxID=48698 RepID=UPI0007B927EC|nr:PREDICTED: high-affinity choline transporter 1-like [Poecilia formosa]